MDGALLVLTIVSALGCGLVGGILLNHVRTAAALAAAAAHVGAVHAG